MPTCFTIDAVTDATFYDSMSNNVDSYSNGIAYDDAAILAGDPNAVPSIQPVTIEISQFEPTPVAPTPVAPTPVAPTPVEPTPIAPSPQPVNTVTSFPLPPPPPSTLGRNSSRISLNTPSSPPSLVQPITPPFARPMSLSSNSSNTMRNSTRSENLLAQLPAVPTNQPSREPVQLTDEDMRTLTLIAEM